MFLKKLKTFPSGKKLVKSNATRAAQDMSLADYDVDGDNWALEDK